MYTFLGVSIKKKIMEYVLSFKAQTRLLPSWVKCLLYSSPMRFLTVTTLIYANGVGITMAAGIRLTVQ